MVIARDLIIQSVDILIMRPQAIIGFSAVMFPTASNNIARVGRTAYRVLARTESIDEDRPAPTPTRPDR